MLHFFCKCLWWPKHFSFLRHFSVLLFTLTWLALPYTHFVCLQLSELINRLPNLGLLILFSLDC
jgi:hypothetical protein